MVEVIKLWNFIVFTGVILAIIIPPITGRHSEKYQISDYESFLNDEQSPGLVQVRKRDDKLSWKNMAKFVDYETLATSVHVPRMKRRGRRTRKKGGNSKENGKPRRQDHETSTEIEARSEEKNRMKRRRIIGKPAAKKA